MAAIDFYRATRDHRLVCDISIKVINKSKKKKKNGTVFVGWIRSTSILWAKTVECNVCAVDWSRLANYEYSVAALVHTKSVASFIVQFMEFLVRNGMNVTQTAIAGHSLGAQVASYVGQRYEGALDAIYGSCFFTRNCRAT